METRHIVEGSSMKLVFLLEERSMKELLDGILPRMLPEDVAFETIAHSGKSDLQKSIPIKLRAWNEPGVKFVIVQDQDANDCYQLKQELTELCLGTGRSFLVRIVCRELEAWYFGDLDALSIAYGLEKKRIVNKKKYRFPDEIAYPKQELNRLLGQSGQIKRAKTIAPFMKIEQNRSYSFRVFREGIKRLCEAES